jgi:hypothetical protein
MCNFAYNKERLESLGNNSHIAAKSKPYGFCNTCPNRNECLKDLDKIALYTDKQAIKVLNDILKLVVMICILSLLMIIYSSLKVM